MSEVISLRQVPRDILWPHRRPLKRDVPPRAKTIEPDPPDEEAIEMMIQSSSLSP
jgi:hypothetical protein